MKKINNSEDPIVIEARLERAMAGIKHLGEALTTTSFLESIDADIVRSMVWGLYQSLMFDTPWPLKEDEESTEWGEKYKDSTRGDKYFRQAFGATEDHLDDIKFGDFESFNREHKVKSYVSKEK